MSWPPTRIVPDSGSTKPAIERKQRCLAAAAAAEKRDHLAALDVQAHLVENAHAAVGHGQRFDRQIGRHSRNGGLDDPTAQV